MVGVSVNAVFRNCMMPIKIECECGQRYAFDVEPVNGRMPTRVACPTCGTDGTSAANDHIARLFPSVPESSPVIRLIELPGQSQSRTAPIRVELGASRPSSSATTQTSATTAVAPPPMRVAAVAAPAPLAAPTPSTVRLSVTATPVQRTAPAPASGRPDPRLGLVDRTQAEHEARAKAMWGDTKEQIVSYLMIQGFSVRRPTNWRRNYLKNAPPLSGATASEKSLKGSD